MSEDQELITYNRQRVFKDGNALTMIGNWSEWISTSSRERNEGWGRREQNGRRDPFTLHVFNFKGICHCSFVWFDDLIAK